MKVERADLEQRFAALADGELLERLGGELTELAREVAGLEAARRGLLPQEAGAAAETVPAHGPMKVCARYVNPMDAQVLAACLQNSDIEAHVMDSDTIYANGALFGSMMLGGVRVMVPESQFEEALRIRAAFDAGEFAIDEDFDVGK